MLKSAVPRIAEVFETPLLLIVADVTESVVVKLPTEDEMGGWWNNTYRGANYYMSFAFIVCI